MNFLEFWFGIFSLSFLRLHFGGSSKSSSSNTTSNYDKRVAVQDGFGLSGDNNTVQMLDGGAIDQAFKFSGETVSRALDSVDSNNATLGAGYESLIDASREIFNSGQNLIGQTQKAVADAYGNAQADKAGTIDNRTLIVLAAAGAATLFFITRRK